MNDYVQARFDIESCSEVMTDVLAALLAERGFESFVPDSRGLTAYIQESLFDSSLLRFSSEEWPFGSEISVSSEIIPGKDWNAEWEKNYFRPIVIDDKCVIHSSFHTDFPQCPLDIVIDPKMAFGTGHHATTSLIVSQLLSMDLSGRKFVDMGTGTGILAIIARKRGANPVIAVEIDPVAFENTKENILLNQCADIDVRLGDVGAIVDVQGVDVFVANINRNVITADLPAYVSTLSPGAIIILSGFLKSDRQIIEDAVKKQGLKLRSVLGEGDWISVSAEK